MTQVNVLLFAIVLSASAAAEPAVAVPAPAQAETHAAAGEWREAYEARTRQLAEHEAQSKLREQAVAERIRTLRSTALGLFGALLVVLTVFFVRVMHDRKRLRDLAQTDELTRLPNRRHLLAAAGQALQRARGDHEPLALLALDIDLFKQVNDAHGHPAGDKVLRQVAHACRLALRPTDLLGRTGGGEFIAVLPNTAESDAAMVAERLRAAVAALVLDPIVQGLRITASVGAAGWDGEELLPRLVSRADTRLYRAKTDGRDRVVAKG